MANVPKEHRAVLIPEPYAKAKVENVPTPQLDASKNEVLIKITATAINPVDWKMRDYNIFVEKYPFLPGSDAAGEIVATSGDGDKKFKTGDRVFFQGIIGTIEGASFQEYAKMPADLVAHTPENVSDDQAAGISLASIAVIVGFYNNTGIDLTPKPWESANASSPPGKGKGIVIVGGSSSVGQYAIQLARLSGFDSIVTGSSSAHHDHLRKLGATDVLDRHKATAEDYYKAANAKGHSFSVVFDSIGGDDSMKLGIDVLTAAGQEARTAANDLKLSKPTLITVYSAEDHVQKAADAADVELKTVWGIGSAPYLRPQAGPFMDALGGPKGWLATGKFQPNRPIVVKGGLSNIEEALGKNKAGVSGEKVVIHPFDG